MLRFANLVIKKPEQERFGMVGTKEPRRYKLSEHKFPSEVTDLPSEGKLYPKEHPCSNGKIELKYMTAKEEDILTSQNLIQKGLVIDRLLDSLILTNGVKSNDLLLGDKNQLWSMNITYGRI